MKKSNKIAFSFLAVIAVILLLLFIAGMVAKQKINDYAEEDLAEILEYEELDVAVFQSRIALKAPEISAGNISIKAEEILLQGFSYYEYLWNGKLMLENVEMNGPEIVLMENEEDSTKPNDTSENNFRQDLLIKSLDITDGIVRKAGNDSSGDSFFMSLQHFNLEGLAVDSATVKQKVPFEYDSYRFEVDSIKMEMDDRHDFSTGRLSGENGNFSLEQIKIVPKYDKVEFQQQIPYEKDRFELSVDTVSLEDFSWSFEEDSLQLKNSLIRVSGADLEVFRDKQAPDDLREKTLYSEKLRNLPVKINIEHIDIEESKIVYQEKIEADRPPGEVRFHELEGEIENLTNIDLGREDFPKTVVNANALFNNETPVEVDWEFDISSEAEVFTISGSLENVSANAINSFLRPAMNVEARGGIESLYFTYIGNNNVATGDVRITYRDFKVNILKDDGTEKSSFWSALANLFINNDAVNEDITHEDLQVARDEKKSFWNYLWLMVREGALSSFI